MADRADLTEDDLRQAEEAGYEAGRRAAERRALIVLGAVVHAAGGQVKVDDRQLVVNHRLSQWTDPFGYTVFQSEEVV